MCHTSFAECLPQSRPSGYGQLYPGFVPSATHSWFWCGSSYFRVSNHVLLPLLLSNLFLFSSADTTALANNIISRWFLSARVSELANFWFCYYTTPHSRVMPLDVSRYSFSRPSLSSWLSSFSAFTIRYHQAPFGYSELSLVFLFFPFLMLHFSSSTCPDLHHVPHAGDQTHSCNTAQHRPCLPFQDKVTSLVFDHCHLWARSLLLPRLCHLLFLPNWFSPSSVCYGNKNGTFGARSSCYTYYTCAPDVSLLFLLSFSGLTPFSSIIRRPASHVLTINSTALGTTGSQVPTVINAGRGVTEDAPLVTLLMRCTILPCVLLLLHSTTFLVDSSSVFFSSSSS